MPFSVRAAREERRDLFFLPAGKRVVKFRVAGGARPRWLWAALFDGNERLWQSNGTFEAESEVELTVSAPPGTYQLQSSAEGGWVGSRELTIPAIGVEAGVVELELRAGG